MAQIRYIQEDFYSLVVAGSFGNKTHSIFRNLQKHTATIPPSTIETLKSAVALAAVPEQQEYQRGMFGGGYRGRFNGSWHHHNNPYHGHFGTGRGRGGFNEPAAYPGFQPRSVATDRQLTQE